MHGEKLQMNTRIRILVFSLLPCLALSVALANTDTRSVDTEIIISASPKEVLQAFLSDDDLKAWWKVSRSLVEPKHGGVWSITWDDWGPEKTQHAWIGVIDEVTPNTLVIGHLVMIEPDMPLLGPMQLEISVSPTTGGTLLRLSHRGYRYGDHWDAMYDMVVKGWDHVLGDMAAWFQEDY
jgi:uncharacterized protein YndB with AHSA1/START domain